MNIFLWFKVLALLQYSLFHCANALEKTLNINRKFTQISTTAETVIRDEFLEVDTFRCPLGCHCVYELFNTLSTSRWINQMVNMGNTISQRYDEEKKPDNTQQNDVQYEDDLDNTLIKQATCMIHVDSDVVELVNSLPVDLQALVIIYTSVGHGRTLNTSILLPLNQLTILEVRGASALRLVVDAPLSVLQFSNFENVQLMGSEKLKRTKAAIDPNDQFDYKPRVEFYDANEYTDIARNIAFKLDFERAREDELEILPSYEKYMQEVKKLRMPSFYGWINLEVLRIHNCQLNELHWEIFDGLTALQHLSLEQNGIESLPPFALYGALHIKTLSLAHNRLHKLHYRALGGLLELKILNLRDNRLEKLSELSFPPFPNLMHIDFRNNPLRYIFPATFWVMNETREMHFGSSETALELWGNHVFDSLRKLNTLTIANVSIESLEQGVLKGLHSLKFLKLHGNIRSIEFDAFAEMSHLRKLDLSHCNIHELSMDALMGCKKLSYLNLAHNNITYIPPGLFDEQKHLEDIYLDHNQLRSLPHSFFQQPKLSLARLNKNPWQCNCDMYNWKPKVTNAIRDSSRERCITDYMTGKNISCRRLEHFKHDKSLAPRCDNYNGQSVYYVLRKQLHCGEGNVLKQLHSKTYNRNQPHWQKVEQFLTGRKQANKLQPYSNVQQQYTKNQKLEKTWTHKQNSLDVVMQKQELSPERYLNENDDKENSNLSNEI